MSAAELRKALEQRFDDGQRTLVPVIGSGLHLHLAGRTGNPAWEQLFDWTGLLDGVAAAAKLTTPQPQDLPMRWESLVLATTERTPRKTASEVETRMIKEHLVPQLRCPTEAGDAAALRTLGEQLLDYRDVVTLNFDDAIDRALTTAGARRQRRKTSENEVGDVSVWRHGERTVRVWHAHGSLRRPKSIVLGTRVYGVAATKLINGFKRAKQAERLWLKRNSESGSWTAKRAAAWQAERRAPAAKLGDGRLGVMDLFLSAPLAFIGTSLGISETDLWWALHQRARNLAHVAAADRPGLFSLHNDESKVHLAASPAGLRRVICATWDDAWGLLLPVR